MSQEAVHRLSPGATAIANQDSDRDFFQRMDQELAGWDEPMARLLQVLEKDELVL